MESLFNKVTEFEINNTSKLRWPTSVTAEEKLPRQKKNARAKKEIGRGKSKKLPAKEKLPRQKRNRSRKRKNLAAKEKCSRQKEIGHSKREIPAAK